MKLEKNKNYIFCGDNLDWLKELPDESVDLCYIDPPFFSNRNYEVIWGNGYELRSFGDRFAGGISHYIEWMRPRIELIHAKLKKTGSIFLHCDWHAGHRLRVLLDEIFDDKNFVNEIVWTYSAFKRKTARNFPRKHDVILFYRKDRDNFVWSTQFKPHRPEYLKRWKKDKNGRYYRDDVNPTKGGTRVIYLDELEGEIVDSVWDDIPPVNPMAKERLGYPTQKPEGLLKRIIESASARGSVVLDCFGGGGTTAKVAFDLGRKFITGDVSPVAVKIMAERLLFDCPKVTFEIKNLPQTEKELKAMNGHIFAETVCEVMGWKVNEKKSGDGGIDGWTNDGTPIQIKNQSKAAGRPDLQKFYGALGKQKKGIFVAWRFASEAYEYIAEVKRIHKIEITAFECSKIFGGLLLDSSKGKEIEELYLERRPKNWAANIAAASSQKEGIALTTEAKKKTSKKGKRKSEAEAN